MRRNPFEVPPFLSGNLWIGSIFRWVEEHNPLSGWLDRSQSTKYATSGAIKVGVGENKLPLL